jgi:hypothetical protein
MAHRGGALAIAVYSGLGGADTFDALPLCARPHLAVHDIAQLQTIYDRR